MTLNVHMACEGGTQKIGAGRVVLAVLEYGGTSASNSVGFLGVYIGDMIFTT
jgi:hypothetical protein